MEEVREKTLCPPPPLHPVSTGPCPLHTTPRHTHRQASLSPLASRGLYEGEGEHCPVSLSCLYRLKSISRNGDQHTSLHQLAQGFCGGEGEDTAPTSPPHSPSCLHGPTSTPHHTMLVDRRLSLSLHEQAQGFYGGEGEDTAPTSPPHSPSCLYRPTSTPRHAGRQASLSLCLH